MSLPRYSRFDSCSAGLLGPEARPVEGNGSVARLLLSLGLSLGVLGLSSSVAVEGVCNDSVSPGLDTAVIAVSSSAEPGLSREVLDRRSSKDVSIGGRGVLGVRGVRGVPGTTFGVGGTGGNAGVFDLSVDTLTGCGTGGVADGFESTKISANTWGTACFAASGAACGSDFCVVDDDVEALRRPEKALNACSTDGFFPGLGSFSDAFVS